MLKKIKQISLLLLLLFICYMLSTSLKEVEDLMVHFIDVGQGDAILLQFKKANVLIDTGIEAEYIQLYTYLSKKSVRKIDTLIVTHPDSDHMGAADYVIRDFSVKKIYMTTYKSKTKEYKEMLRAIKKYKVERINVKEGSTIPVGSLKSMVLSANTKVDKSNDSSIVLLLQHGDNRFLFSSDAPAKVENKIKEKYDIDVDVLKVAHHGSASSSPIAYLKEASPEYSIISVGIDNKYGHPVSSVLKRLNKYGKQTLRTDLCGTIVMASDGNEIACQCERENGTKDVAK